MNSLYSINRVKIRKSCLSCKLVSNSLRTEIIHSKETLERSPRVHLIWCYKVHRRIMRSTWTWWISSHLMKVDKAHLTVSKWFPGTKSALHSFSSNRALFQTLKESHLDISTPLWAPTTSWHNANLIWTHNSTTPPAELHTKTTSKCYNKCKSKTCTCKSNHKICKTAEPQARIRCSTPTTTTDNSISVSP